MSFLLAVLQVTLGTVSPWSTPMIAFLVAGIILILPLFSSITLSAEAKIAAGLVVVFSLVAFVYRWLERRWRNKHLAQPVDKLVSVQIALHKDATGALLMTCEASAIPGWIPELPLAQGLWLTSVTASRPKVSGTSHLVDSIEREVDPDFHVPFAISIPVTGRATVPFQPLRAEPCQPGSPYELTVTGSVLISNVIIAGTWKASVIIPR